MTEPGFCSRAECNHAQLAHTPDRCMMPGCKCPSYLPPDGTAAIEYGATSPAAAPAEPAAPVVRLITYKFRVRRDLWLDIALPDDFKARDLERLHTGMAALLFHDDPEPVYAGTPGALPCADCSHEQSMHMGGDECACLQAGCSCPRFVSDGAGP